MKKHILLVIVSFTQITLSGSLIDFGEITVYPDTITSSDTLHLQINPLDTVHTVWIETTDSNDRIVDSIFVRVISGDIYHVIWFGAEDKDPWYKQNLYYLGQIYDTLFYCEDYPGNHELYLEKYDDLILNEFAIFNSKELVNNDTLKIAENYLIEVIFKFNTGESCSFIVIGKDIQTSTVFNSKKINKPDVISANYHLGGYYNLRGQRIEYKLVTPGIYLEYFSAKKYNLNQTNKLIVIENFKR